jgi:methylglutaconyl-CoA hydratase
METLTSFVDSAGVARVTLQRPEVHNAFNLKVIEEVTKIFQELGESPYVRMIVLAGSGKSFSAGADAEWMKAQGLASPEENRATARLMLTMFETIERCPKPVIGRIHGAALGGGVGLVCAVDIAVAGPNAVFGFTEVRLGILPAVISPYAIRRIGESQARARFLTGSRFRAEEALRIGMVHYLAEDLDAQIDHICSELTQAAPDAVSATKQLVREVTALDPALVGEHTVETTSRARASQEGREGMAAFLEKRVPSWVLKTEPLT